MADLPQLQRRASFADKVKESVCRKLIDERHLQEIMQLSVNRHLSTWLTTEEARQQMVDKTIKQPGASVANLPQLNAAWKVQLAEKLEEIEKNRSSTRCDCTSFISLRERKV